MTRARRAQDRRNSAGPDPLRIAFFATSALLVLGLAVSLLAPQLAWPLANILILGFPAAFVVVSARESIRWLLAKVLGFRTFGFQLGIGRVLWRRRFGRTHFRLAPLPLGGDDRFASGQPHHHRASRIGLCLAPPIAQCLFSVWALWTGDLSSASLDRDFAPLAMIQLANSLILAYQLLIPFESKQGWGTDILRLARLAFSTLEDDRSARATARSLETEALLSRGDLEGARKELADAMTQLGREKRLVAIETRLDQISCSPEPEQAARIRAQPDPFEHAETSWHNERAPLSFVRRTFRAALQITPALVCLTLFCGTQYDALIRGTHARWTEEAQSLSIGHDASACHAHLSVYEDRLSRLTLFSSTPRPMQVRELRARSALHACTGNFDRAIRDQSLAVEIADAHRREDVIGRAPDSSARIDAELIHASQLRQLAAWHAARGAYRDALRATRRAEMELESADHLAMRAPQTEQRDWALDMLSREREQLEWTRQQILDGMDIRG